ncbi:hypothetical protein ABZ281_45410, partial [Streptomyces sp. NPDC006265]
MAQRHLDPTDPRAGHAGPAPTGDALAGYLRAQATEFLRALRLHRETGSGAGGSEGSAEAARALRRSARRVSAGLHTFQSLLLNVLGLILSAVLLAMACVKADRV